jgi:hypothetical protein
VERRYSALADEFRALQQSHKQQSTELQSLNQVCEVALGMQLQLLGSTWPWQGTTLHLQPAQTIMERTDLVHALS